MDSASRLSGETGRAFGHGRPLDGASDAAQIAVLAIPITGLLLMIVQLFRKVAVWSWRTTRNRPIHRGAALLTMGAAVTVLALSWIPAHHYQPIGPGERGTEGEGFHALFSLAGGPGPLYSQQVALQHTTHPPSHSPAQPTNRPPAQLPPTSPVPPPPALRLRRPGHRADGATNQRTRAPRTIRHPAESDPPARHRAPHAARHPPARHRTPHPPGRHRAPHAAGQRPCPDGALDTSRPKTANRQNAIGYPAVTRRTEASSPATPPNKQRSTALRGGGRSQMSTGVRYLEAAPARERREPSLQPLVTKDVYRQSDS